MSPRLPAEVEGKLRVTVSGSTFQSANLGAWDVRPSKSRKVGYGVQHAYMLDPDEVRRLVDLLAAAACDAAEVADNDAVVNAIYTDMEPMLEAVG